MDNIFELNKNNFLCGTSDLEQFRNSPQRVEHFLILFCMEGEATILLNEKPFHFEKDMPWVILPGNIISVEEKSNNFTAQYCYTKKKYLDEVTLRISPRFFEFVQNDPPDYRTEAAIAYIRLFFDMILRVQNEKNHFFREEIFKNLLQNYLYELFDKTFRLYALQQKKTYNQPEILFKQFMELIRENYAVHHDVQFYADTMCISARYLSQITQKIARTSPKKILYEYTVLEIRQRLKNSTLSIQEIAIAFDFNDQFTMGRIFKQYTGMTPTEYRKK